MIIEKYGRSPCDDGWISQGYKNNHKAIDVGFLTKYGKNRPVKAWKSGVVVATGTDSYGGVYVVLKHEDDDFTWITRYWHLVKGSVVVKKGQEVKQGDKLGTRGDTGISTGVHLHFEVWKAPKGYSYKSSDYNKYAINPLSCTYVYDGQVIKDGYNKGETMKAKPEEVKEPTPIAEDTTRHQVEIIADVLRVRATPSLNGDQICIAKKGLYNVLEEKVADGYTWYRIDEDRWVATKESEWTIDKPIVKVPTSDEIIADLTAKLSALEKELADTKNALKTAENALKDKETIIENVRKAVG